MHDEVNENMVSGWHASLSYACYIDFSRKYHLTSHSNQIVYGQSSNLEVECGDMDQCDIHDHALVLEILRTSIMSRIVSSNKQDCVL